MYRRLLDVRCHDANLSEAPRGAGQGNQPGAVNSVVVGDQDAGVGQVEEVGAGHEVDVFLHSISDAQAGVEDSGDHLGDVGAGHVGVRHVGADGDPAGTGVGQDDIEEVLRHVAEVNAVYVEGVRTAEPPSLDQTFEVLHDLQIALGNDLRLDRVRLHRVRRPPGPT